MDYIKILYKIIVYFIKSPVHKFIVKAILFLYEKIFIFIILPISLLVLKHSIKFSITKIAPRIIKSYFKNTFPGMIKGKLKKTYPISLVLKYIK